MVHNAEIRELIANGFFDFHTLPIDPQRLRVTLGHAYGMAELLHRTVTGPLNHKSISHEIVGVSRSVQQLINEIRKVAAVDEPVLVTGESGTGKEMVSQQIHQLSARANCQFHAVNCGALPSALIQSELFGHEKGAFTGAHKRKIGRIESASGGTLLLDEVGDLSPDAQAALLRFLQEKVIVRVGGSESIPVDVRIIAATHIDLKQAISDGAFRNDLYHRLNVLHIETPSLCSREGDIEFLAHFFLKEFRSENMSGPRGFSDRALHLMNVYEWPGNVRELRNRIHQAAVMADGRLISPKDLGLDRRSIVRRRATLDDVRARAEKNAIMCALRHTGQNVTLAAKQLGVSRVTLYRMIDKYEILRSCNVLDEAASRI